jgi:hypothetical protein
MLEEDLLKLVVPVDGRFWYLKIPVSEDYLEGVVVTHIELYVDRVGEWQEHYHNSKFTDSDLAVFYTYEGTDPDEAVVSFYADDLFKTSVEKILTDAGFDVSLLDDLVANPISQQEHGRASYSADRLFKFIRTTLMYVHN